MNPPTYTPKEDALRAAGQAAANAANLRNTCGPGNAEKALQLEEKAKGLRIKAATL